jgi:SHAQKYF class myb-like DNA-binding protein
MSKRPLDVESKPRKRFVWPDSLHRAFIGAVLEVGLDASTPKQISDVLPNRGDGSATLDQIKAQIHKLRLYRSTVRVNSASVRMLYFI